VSCRTQKDFPRIFALTSSIIIFAASQTGLRGQQRWGLKKNARVAQLVERNLAKVEVAGSSLVSRSKAEKDL
jgi:hypothetical protein